MRDQTVTAPDPQRFPAAEHARRGGPAARQIVRACLDTLTILSVDRPTLEAAYALGSLDYEDAVQIACAVRHGLDAIITRDKDLAQLVRIGLEHPEIHFEIFYGVSDNAASFWDNSRAHKFGYRPQGRAEDFRQEALAAQAKLPPDPIGARYQGGPFCSAEYDANRKR